MPGRICMTPRAFAPDMSASVEAALCQPIALASEAARRWAAAIDGDRPGARCCSSGSARVGHDRRGGRRLRRAGARRTGRELQQRAGEQHAVRAQPVHRRDRGRRNACTRRDRRERVSVTHLVAAQRRRATVTRAASRPRRARRRGREVAVVRAWSTPRRRSRGLTATIAASARAGRPGLARPVRSREGARREPVRRCDRPERLTWSDDMRHAGARRSGQREQREHGEGQGNGGTAGHGRPPRSRGAIVSAPGDRATPDARLRRLGTPKRR